MPFVVAYSGSELLMQEQHSRAAHIIGHLKTGQPQEINLAIYLNNRYLVRTLSLYGPNRSIV
jgi:hypothetical protein